MSSTATDIPHRWPGEAIEAVLIERPNKFLAICRLGRRTVEAHVPDRGRCLDLLVPGRTVAVVAVRLPATGDRPPVRKTRFTAVLARSGNGTWVSLDPAGAPRLVEEALRRSLLPSLAGLRVVQREVVVGFSRIDLLLAGGRHPVAGGRILCEVKSVGAQRDGIALFPDAPTERGARHLALLSSLARRGRRCAIVFCAQRGDVSAVAPDEEIDPIFAAALRRAVRAGVTVAAVRCAASPAGMQVEGEIAVLS
ncbi:MAG: DNA/RNA nuclease SfsA [Myxococcales bacterium]|nr:DNA/RNA nuclease SfsA [Myxococcales bacterium]